MSNLVNLVKALLGSMFVCSKPKIGCSNLITKSGTHWSLFEVQKIDVRVCLVNNLVDL